MCIGSQNVNSMDLGGKDGYKTRALFNMIMSRGIDILGIQEVGLHLEKAPNEIQ